MRIPVKYLKNPRHVSGARYIAWHCNKVLPSESYDVKSLMHFLRSLNYITVFWLTVHVFSCIF